MCTIFFSAPAIAEKRVLIRDDYLQILSELWDLGRISIPEYLAGKYEKHTRNNPNFVELLYRDIYKIMEDISRPDDGDLAMEDGDLVVELGDFKESGHTNNFHDAMTWLHRKVVEKTLNMDNIADENSILPIVSFPKRMEEFERLFLAGGDDSPAVAQKLKEFNRQLKVERNSYDASLPQDETQAPIVMTNFPDSSAAPKVFISYAWDDETKAWVKDFAKQLRADGIDAVIDQWQLAPGDQLTHFMERAVRENSYVLIICTPHYKAKSDNRKGGVGYEGDVMTAEVFQNSNHRKYIPILLTGSKETSLPSWLSGKYYVDLANAQRYREGYEDLVTTIFQVREAAPPLGQRPAFISDTTPAAPPVALKAESSEEIKIRGVLVDEVTTPRNDGTKGSALYAIPFELNRHPSKEWVEYFIQSWNVPPQFTTMHRPRIASVSGNKIILNGTDIEEVERYHRDTLKLCVDVANKKWDQLRRERHANEEQQRQQAESHQEKLDRISKRISFD